ncbi:MAG: transcription-repair coupling factor [Actinomycetes bacterium]
MTLAGLLDAVVADPALDFARGAVGAPAVDIAAPPSMRPLAVATLAAEAPRGAGRFVLAVTATSREATDLAEQLRSFLPATAVAEFPSWETLPHERLSPRADTVGRRLAVLRRLRHPQPDDARSGPLSVVVAPVRSLLQPQVRGLGDIEPLTVHVGDELVLDNAVARLVEIAYTRVELVERRGEFAVRGGILDVFPPDDEHPVRLELWGDTVEEIRQFAVSDQRSLGNAPHGLWAPPCRELLLTADVRARAKALLQERPGLADILERISDGMPVEGMEALAPVLTDEMELLVDVLPAGAHVVVCDPERVRARAHELVRTSQEFLEASWAAAATGREAPLDLGAAAYRTLGDVRGHADELGLPWWTVSPFSLDDETVDDAVVHRVDARPADAYRGDMQRAFGDIKEWLSQRWRVCLVTEGHGPAERLAESLAGEDIAARLGSGLDIAPEPAVTHVVTGCLDHGFVAPGIGVVVLTETDLVGLKSSTKEMRRMPSRRRGGIDLLSLVSGDYVVHEQHGVGRYIEMVQRTVAGATRDYLVLEYARGDRLYVPTDALDQVTRYSGGDSPTLDRLGGADWAKRKGRARKAVREIAAGLIRLYSARMASPGHAFGPDTPWQRELEDAFPYVETPDQSQSIDEVKADMEAPVPMDRVICGDVGYGKTEIAVRAAFKGVMDGKQVAILVPTTLLAQQHFVTFNERFAAFPVEVRVDSRFSTMKEHTDVLAGLADGTIDVVIGTHRLLSPDTKFHDLGLVVVDEEQRFGVEHKEYLKQLRANVDVLTMSATPIPRTLEMAITGIRQMSTIQTPPEERHPVLTFVGAYDERQVAAAIRRELLREGQAFYVHNRVESIEKAAARVRDLVPEARVAVAHGQMNEDLLERTMVDFWERAYDVLVCTTIIESGLDIANANTLIVDRADVLGLSQLHQIRGRVGRSRERGYAYFLYPPDRSLTETAHNRLATVAQHTEFGAGAAIAMKDLEIRGAGNLLGGEQSGHIAAVGFDLYVRLVGEAVADFRGERNEEPPEVKIDLPVDAHLPHDYVPGERLRLEAYRRLAAAADEAEVEAARAELVDRYGAAPAAVENLLAVALLRVRARRAGLTEIGAAGNQVRFTPVQLPESRVVRLQRLYPRSVVKATTGTMLVPRPTTARIGGTALRDRELLAWASEVIEAILPDGVAAEAATAT